MHILFQIFLVELLLLTNGYIANSTQEDIVFVSNALDNLKGNQRVEIIRTILNKLVQNAEKYANEHTSYVPTVHFTYTDPNTSQKISYEASYNTEITNSINSYTASLEEVINALRTDEKYKIDFSYNENGVLQELFINESN